MTALMMLPLASSSALLVGERSLRTRRTRSVVEHLAGFGAVWAVFGLCAGAALAPLHEAADPAIVFTAIAALAIAWQLSARRLVAAARCGYVRVGPVRGWRADLHTVAAGGRHALPCLRTCGPAMAAMVAAPHPVVMVILFAAYLSEWARGPNPFAWARYLRPVPGYAVVAAGTAVTALV